jgi:hypothetical protein
VTSTSRHLRPRRLAARLLAVTALLLGMGVAGLVAADTSTAAACTSSSGVTVVVDYGSLGGTSVGCATGPGNGIEVLQAAGHSVEYVPRQQGLVCTIDGRTDPCNGAPTTAYWSYWHAKPGGTWSYSTQGAATYDAKSGTVEGWAFGAGKPPALRPPSRPRTATSSTTSPSRTTTSRPASTAAAGPSGEGSTTATTTGPTVTARTTTATATASATSASTLSPSDDATTDAMTATTATRTDAAAPTSATSSSGGTGTLVVAALLVLLLAGGGGVLAWRRHGRDA